VRRALLVLTTGCWLLLVGVPRASTQTASFSGRYRLSLTFATNCQASVRSVSVSLDLAESPVDSGSEVSGELTAPYEASVGRFLLLRRTRSLHGPFSTLGGRAYREPITTVEGHYLMPWLMLDGAASSGSGRPRASGTAIGVLQVGNPGDEYPDTLGSCTARDHRWTLEPE